ncbi:nicotinamide riboside transporter PnuC [Seonamhaeicola sp.]|uniref:nicotinamide riboside transporter PnuC n=1 Tax=Seonamhaeicola sp. TaxID=1912245 RepID=UPI0026131795|nr:nicotinamide riboside transporter PnuC [Seonamhaeicola sp.]
MDLYLEIIAVICGLAYLVFLIKEQILCWLFGIIGSLFSIVLFYKTQLYSEAILYTYYVIIGVYGWIYWKRSTQQNQVFKVTDLPVRHYLFIILIGEVLSLLLGYFFGNYTDAAAPYLDAHTTIFSFIASYMEVKKWLGSWKFWIVINGVTIALYLGKDLNWYSALTVVYLIFSFVGYFKWKQQMQPA